MMDLISFPDASRVWVYQANKALPDGVLADVHNKVITFAKQWVAHKSALASTGSILHNRFVILVVDESKLGASGCSIDSSVHFLKALGEEYDVDFFDRNRYSYIRDEEVKTCNDGDLARLYTNGVIDDNTMVFDNLVSNKEDFIQRWVLPFGSSWIKRHVLR